MGLLSRNRHNGDTPTTESVRHGDALPPSVLGVPNKIALLHHVGGGNLGDDATLDAVVENIKRRWPDADLGAFTMNPADTEARHGIPAYPIRVKTWQTGARPPDVSTPETGLIAVLKKRPLFRLLKTCRLAIRSFLREIPFLITAFRTIRPFDLLIVSGGGQLLDVWGPWAFPYTLFKWVFLARLAGVKCRFLNVGAGPLDHGLSRWFVRRALLLAEHVSLRDADSQALLRKIGFHGEAEVAADSVYSLTIHETRKRQVPRPTDPTVGLSPMAYGDPRVYWQKSQDAYTNLIRTLSSFGSWLTQHDYRLTLFSTDVWFDSQVIHELERELKSSASRAIPGRISRPPVFTFDDLISQMVPMEYVITCRFHGVVFAHLLNKPVLALSHHPKVLTLMTDLGLQEYCLDIKTTDLTLLTSTFASLVKSRDQIKRQMSAKKECYRQILSTQFDRLFAAPPEAGRLHAKALAGRQAPANSPLVDLESKDF